MPFEGMDLDQVKTVIIEKNARPKVNDKMRKEIAQMIRECWQDDFEKRSNFGDISEILMEIHLDQKGQN